MKLSIIAALALLLVSYGAAMAVPQGKELVFEKSPLGKVTFKGSTHSAFNCEECHNPLMFPKKKRGTAKMQMAFLHSGRLCGKCHNGQTAFKPLGNCERCHIE